jgi:hypothetical protein
MKRTSAGFAIALAGCVLVGARALSSQQPLASASAIQTRTQAIVASFDKAKHEVKEKRGVRMEKYKKVQNEAVVKSNPADYSGTYEADMGFSIHLKVDRNGNVEGEGYEPLSMDSRVMRRFTLRNARIDGALLTGRKVYAGGASDPLEGVFINRTTFDSPTDPGLTTFGLGLTGADVRVSGVTFDRLFYQLKR